MAESIVDQRQRDIGIIENAINEVLENPSDRIILKLFLSGCKVDDIAQLAGVSKEVILGALQKGEHRLEHRLGCLFSTIRLICINT
jgi:hypothetical protein